MYESGATAHPNTAVPYSGKTLQFVGPQDFATIYNLNPAWKAGYRGKGQTVAVVEDTFMKAADVTTFRKAFGLSGYAGTFSQVSPAGTVPCQNPGINSNETEAALDAEWAGATAPDAAIVLAACADTRTQGGEFIALMDLLDQKNPPDAISLSYGLCEPAMGVVTAAQISSAYQQAAAEGVSIFVSSGDQGAASCDYGAEEAVYGIATNGLATTPYNVAVGGTDFYDTIQKTGNQYWHASNGAGLESAISYIPEKTWNDSCADSDVMAYFGATQAYGSNGACAQYPGDVYGLNTGAGSGGPSTVYPKSYASWQTGVYGLPADHSRDIPDVSLFSSDGQWWGHAMLFCNSDVRTWDVPCVYTNSKDAVYSTAGGTSFAAPAMAGIFALITQKYGRQGNPDYGLYALAAQEYGSPSNPNNANLTACNSTHGNQAASSCTFYDITQGNIAVPCFSLLNCYGLDSDYGTPDVLSVSDLVFKPAYPSTKGWDFATGLGSINVTNLLNNWSSVSQ